MSYYGELNYITWLVKVRFENEPELYYLLRDMAREAWRQDPEQAQAITSEALREYLQRNAPKLEGVYSDLMTAALAEVDYFSIAGYALEEVENENK